MELSNKYKSGGYKDINCIKGILSMIENFTESDWLKTNIEVTADLCNDGTACYHMVLPYMQGLVIDFLYYKTPEDNTVLYCIRVFPMKHYSGFVYLDCIDYYEANEDNKDYQYIIESFNKILVNLDKYVNINFCRNRVQEIIDNFVRTHDNATNICNVVSR